MELLARHRKQESCNECHARLDPWGIPFEHYNAIGKFQPLVPFAPLKDYVSYLRGLDHVGGQKLGGHSAGDVFATGADMVGTQKTNNISIDQLAANHLGHETRYASLVLGSEGGTGSYGQAKTLSHRGPGSPIPSLHRPQEIFNRLFNPCAGDGVEQVRARLKRETSTRWTSISNLSAPSNSVSSAPANGRSNRCPPWAPKG